MRRSSQDRDAGRALQPELRVDCSSVASRICVEPQSAVDLWASLVVNLAESPGDVRSLEAWARLTGKSISSIRAHCYAVNVRPRHGLLFARVLRAVVQGQRQEEWDLAEWILAASKKTLLEIAAVSGVPPVATHPPAVSEYLNQQSLLPVDSAPLRRGRYFAFRLTPSATTSPAAAE